MAAASSDHRLVAVHRRIVVAEMRPSDGYINATTMCQAGQKRWHNYWRTTTTQTFLQGLSSSMSVPVMDLVLSQHGGRHNGTWVHHLVAIHLAKWISANFVVAVIDLVCRSVSMRASFEQNQTSRIQAGVGTGTNQTR